MAAPDDLPEIHAYGNDLVAIVDELVALAPARLLVDPALVEAASPA